MLRLTVRVFWPAALLGGVWGLLVAIAVQLFTPWLWLMMIMPLCIGYEIGVQRLGRFEAAMAKRQAKLAEEARQKRERRIAVLEAELGLKPLCPRCRDRVLHPDRFRWRLPVLSETWGGDMTCEECQIPFWGRGE